MRFTDQKAERGRCVVDWFSERHAPCQTSSYFDGSPSGQSSTPSLLRSSCFSSPSVHDTGFMRSTKLSATRSKGIINLGARFKEPCDEDLAGGGWDAVLERLSEQSDEESFGPDDEADEDSFRPDESWVSSDFGDSELSVLSGATMTSDKIRFFTTEGLPDWITLLAASSSSSSDGSYDESAEASDSLHEFAEQRPFMRRRLPDAGVEVFWKEILADAADADSGSGDNDEVCSI